MYTKFARLASFQTSAHQVHITHLNSSIDHKTNFEYLLPELPSDTLDSHGTVLSGASVLLEPL